MDRLSPLIDILKDELTVQRVFLSTDEARALGRDADGDDDGDLAYERVKARRYLFFAALRDRFVLDGRPVDQWLDWIADEERLAGGRPTVASALASRVVEWSIRATDRKSMAMGFIAATARWLAMAILALGAWAWSRDLGPATWVLVAVGIAGWVVARLVARATERHVRATIAAELARHGAGTAGATGIVTSGE